jgi:hypothetical protein
MIQRIKSGLIHQLWSQLPLTKPAPQLLQGHLMGSLENSKFWLQIFSLHCNPSQN